MTSLKNAHRFLLSTALAAALLSAVSAAPAFAQSFSEPAAFAAAHPDRDVLNGGILTPEARLNAAHAEAPVVIVKHAGHSARKAH